MAARLERVAKPRAICLSEQAYWQVKGRLDLKVNDLGHTQLKNIAELRLPPAPSGAQRYHEPRLKPRRRLCCSFTEWCGSWK
jgi:class 3 adenylate cyclase